MSNMVNQLEISFVNLEFTRSGGVGTILVTQCNIFQMWSVCLQPAMGTHQPQDEIFTNPAIYPSFLLFQSKHCIFIIIPPGL